MRTDLNGTRVHLTGEPHITGTVTGSDGDFLIIQFSNGFEGRTSRKHAEETLAKGETPRGWIAPSSLAAAARGARQMLDDIRAGKPVPTTGSARDVISAWQAQQSKATATAATMGNNKSADEIIRDWQSKQPGKKEEATKFASEAQGGGFKASVKREVEAQIKPAIGGAKIVQLVKHCGRRD